MAGAEHVARAGTIVLTAGAIIALTLATSSCASYGSVYGSPPGLSVGDRAHIRGYEDGRRHGEADSRRHRPYDHTRHRAFRDADHGYRGGDRWQYGSFYRRGFVTGYRDGYTGANATRGPARRPAEPAGWYRSRESYRSPAIEQGFRDGFERGIRDARRGNRFDPVHAPEYRSGDRRYDRRYGPRESYKREYRRAFREGYRRGYDQW